MEIRRKVFSLLKDENGEERYFSTTEFEYTQREFSKKDKEKRYKDYLKTLSDEDLSKEMKKHNSRTAVSSAAVVPLLAGAVIAGSKSKNYDHVAQLKKKKFVGALAGAGLSGAGVSLGYAISSKKASNLVHEEQLRRTIKEEN